MEAGPGLSLFQGSDNIQLNAAMQGHEEDEEQEEIKRRDKEIQDRMKNIFDGLEDDDDASSIESSYYQDSVKDTDHINTAINSSLQLATPTMEQVVQLQKDFAVSNSVENLNNYDLDGMTNHRSDSDVDGGGNGGGIMQPNATSEFHLHRPTGTPFVNNRSNDSNSTMLETPYELTKPPNAGYTRKMYHKQVEECTFGENYPYIYETPSSHYNTHPNKYSNNGFADRYQNNVQSKQTHEFGGGDNATSDHMNHCYKTSPNGRPTDDNVAYKTAEYDSKEQLEVMYMVRTREIERLTEELQQLQIEKEDEKNQLDRKLMLLQTEVSRTNISKNEAQQALVDAKAEIANLQMQMESLKEKNAILEKTNQNVTEELNIARGSVMDLQQKIAVLERAQALQTNDKMHEKFLKQAQEKHAVEMRNMQTQIDVLTDKLNAKETSYVALEHKLDDVRRAHETLMVEKGDNMNRLAQALEESQTQCRNLMATNSAQQVMQLQAQVKMLSQEKEELHKNINELQNKLEVAKNDVAQYDSLLALEDESDSIRQMKLGELHNKLRSKPTDDIMNKLKGELQRCVANQALKRKEINRLENTLSQREKELSKAMIASESCRQEAARYAKRVNELEQELKSVLTDQAMKANAQIQKLSDHLNDVKTKYELLRDEKMSLEQKLEETLAVNQETLKKLHQETMEQQEKETIDEYNKEYLEIHAKAIERVKQEAQVEIVQLSVQLEQTEKELDRVKTLYIDVCGTKEQLINEHKNELKMLKNKYATIESHQKNVDKLESELQIQVKQCSKLTNECESFKNKIIELEKNLAHERRKKEDHTRRIHSEIERAKEEALNELRNAHPNQEVSFRLPDHCSEHLEKINQLQEDCKRLEEKLQIAMQEQKKLSEYQTELDDAKLKIAQVEISQESWKKKYENTVNERNDLLANISKLNLELSNLKRTAKLEDLDDVKLKITRFQMENEALKSRCDSLLDEKNTCREKIGELETELSTTKKKIGSLETRIRKSGDISLNSKSELEKELSHYKDLVAQLSRLNNSKEGHMNGSVLEQRIQQLEQDLYDKNEKLNRLKDLEKIKDERDELVIKLRDQAKQFQQYVKSQNQVSELNLSPRSVTDSADLQKMKETTAKEVREEMEQKVVKELRGIGEQHLEKRKELEQKYKTRLLEWQTKYNEKDQDTKTLQKELIAEKMKIGQISQVSQTMKNKLEICNRELQTRIEKLEEDLKQKENEIEEEKNLMAQMITTWVDEINKIKAREIEMNQEIHNQKSKEEELGNEIKTLKDKEKSIRSDIDLWKQKYQRAKKTAYKYKNYAEQRKNFLSDECKRIENGYKKAINQVQQNFQAREERYVSKVKELEHQYTERMEQMRLTLVQK
ncbi:putative leucine-rich repeat-containing protein DDB_G0290503 isoform X2 [Odontomachus brunneus]|uniref:putative leucine-rich repeat-containing protein DDB_G0290503 isoform X2 n=1 Tax=Odontomachus brunneus TaxID=486640 RepID=UPI0013F260E4|nr:putative leucine-rich repeat-containing protein DDB_G0290503 isoform X2 [Odontomachus brunneus]